MSDAPPPGTSPGWWQASDGQWYPPPAPSSQPWGAVPPPGYGYATASRTNGLAIASLVLGILWLGGVGSILALVFGYIAKSQIDASGGTEGGRSLAVAGIVLGYVGLGLTLVWFVLFGILLNEVGDSLDDFSDFSDFSDFEEQLTDQFTTTLGLILNR